MKQKITQEQEDYYHLKYGFSLYTIRSVWNMSDNGDDLEDNFNAAKSLASNLMGARK